MKTHYPEINALLTNIYSQKYSVKAMTAALYAVAANSNLSVSEVIGLMKDAVQEYAEEQKTQEA